MNMLLGLGLMQFSVEDTGGESKQTNNLMVIGYKAWITQLFLRWTWGLGCYHFDYDEDEPRFLRFDSYQFKVCFL